MVRRELWTTILAYNLIRSTAASAAMLHGVKPREISFTSTSQFVLAAWAVISLGQINNQTLLDYATTMLENIAKCRVANRPGRIEPRLIKKRPKQYKHLRVPRSVARQIIKKHLKINDSAIRAASPFCFHADERSRVLLTTEDPDERSDI